MNLSNFEYAVSHTLEAEGVFSNHRWDPGGKTKYGVTETVWDAWLEENWKLRQLGRGLRLENITVHHAKMVYFDEYWLFPGISKIEDRHIAAEVFDTGANCGTVTAIRILQEATNFLRKPDWGEIAVDGKLGPVTRAAARRLVTNGYRLALLRALNGEQYMHYRLNTNKNLQANAARGWMKRLVIAQEVEYPQIGEKT